MIGGLLIGFPGVLLAEGGCVLSGEAEFSSYVSQLSDGINKKTEYLSSQGDADTPEYAFKRGAIGVRAADLFLTVQFDRSGTVTDFDVQRSSDQPVDEVLAYMLDECLVPYEEVLGALAVHIEKHVKFQISEEEMRKIKLEP